MSGPGTKPGPTMEIGMRGDGLEVGEVIPCEVRR